MKRTTTINLAGLVYHIEEDGFQVLKSYFEEIKRVFATQEGVEEMVEDIEARVAELFQERLSKSKEVVTLVDVEEVIAIMGSPSKFDDETSFDEQEKTEQNSNQEKNDQGNSKRLYRDTDEGMLGGVSAGLAHYFNIDPVLLRVLWIVLVIAGGSGVLIYIIAWIAIPEAKTTAQKLHMRGRSANLDNIKSFADSVKSEAKTGFKRASKSAKNAFKKKNNTFSNIARAIGRLFGFVMFIGGIFGLIFIVFFSWADFNFIYMNNGVIATDLGTLIELFFVPTILASWLIFTVLSIPLIFLIIAGGMLLFRRKPKSKALILTLLVLWFLAIVGLSFLGVKTGLEFKETYKLHEKTIIESGFSELSVNLFEDDLMISNSMEPDFDNYLSVSDDKIELGYARIEVLPAEDSIFYYSVEKRSNGGTLKSAKEKAPRLPACRTCRQTRPADREKIKFETDQNGSVLNIPTRYGFPQESKIRGQKVTVKIYVPIGKQIILNGNWEEYPLRIQSA